MARLGSYREMGKKRGGWLDAWKEEGRLSCVLHRTPPHIRLRHSFRKVELDESDRGVKRKVRWLPWTCWETDDYHRARRFDSNPPTAKFCPADRLIEHLEARDDLPDDEVIFSFKGSGRDKREIIKVDLLGNGDSRDSWQDDFTAKTEYVIALIPLKDPKAVLLSNEKWSLGQALLDRIQTDCEEYGDDVGDPEKRPTAYLFEYSPKRNMYSISRNKEGQEKAEKDGTWSGIVELWEGPAPDADPYCRPGDPKELLEAMQEGAVVDLPLDDLFAPALAQWKERKAKENDEATDFDPKKIEEEIKTAKAKKDGRRSTKGKDAKGKQNGAAAKSETAPKKDKPKRAVRQVAKPEPEPEPPDEVQVFECEGCGADWPEDADECPGCGLKAAAPPVDQAGGDDDIPSDPAGDEQPSVGGASRDFKF